MEVDQDWTDIFKCDFLFGEGVVLGVGADGIVHRVKHNKWNKMIAVKTVSTKRSGYGMRELENVYKIRRKCDESSNVVKILGYLKEGLGAQAFGYVMEYMGGGNLDEYIHGTDEYSYARLFDLASQAANGIDFLHSIGILHRDVKPENMLLSSNVDQLKICDFGRSRNFDSTMTLGTGTVRYMAPEMFSKESDTGNYSESCDVYSFGIVLWEMAVRTQPFDGIYNTDHLASLITEGQHPPVKNVNNQLLATQILKYLVTLYSCFTLKPVDRPTMRALQIILLYEHQENSQQWDAHCIMPDSAPRKFIDFTTEYLPNKTRSDIPQYSFPDFDQQIVMLPVGSSGRIHFSHHPVLGNVGIKLLMGKKRTMERAIVQEVEILLKLDHPHIIKGFGFYIQNNEEEKQKIGYVMEFVDGRSIYEMLNSNKSYTRRQLIVWAKQAASALDHIHSQNLLYRHLKPTKLLLSKDKSIIKLCGFSQSREIANTMMRGVGTVTYTAPELMIGEEKVPFTTKSDIYSLGIIIWEMAARKAALPDGNIHSLIVQVTQGMRPTRSDVPDSMLPLIERCWDSVPENRPSAAELCDLLDRYLEEYPHEADVVILGKDLRVTDVDRG